MKPTIIAALASVVFVGLANGQSTLDWASTSAWSGGASTGSYNSGSGAGGAHSSITPLTYDFGGGLTATVWASLDAGTQWQNNSSIFGGYAPRVNSAGLFAFGINNGSTSTGGTLTINFSQAVSLTSFTIGDMDSGGSVLDLVNVQSDAGSLSVIGAAGGAPTYSNSPSNLLSFTGVAANETLFTPSATTGWSTISSGSTMLTTLTVSLLNGTGNHGIWLNDITVSAIPEPSTYALVLGSATLALIVARRRFIRRT